MLLYCTSTIDFYMTFKKISKINRTGTGTGTEEK